MAKVAETGMASLKHIQHHPPKKDSGQLYSKLISLFKLICHSML